MIGLAIAKKNRLMTIVKDVSEKAFYIRLRLMVIETIKYISNAVPLKGCKANKKC